MGSLFECLHIGASALAAQQTGLQVTGNNIANVNTTGYTRQKVVLTPSISVQTTAGQLGTGVNVQSIEALRDQFIDKRVSQCQQAQTKQEQIYNSLSQVEAVFDSSDSDSGLGASISSFFNSFTSLSEDPTSSSLRQSVVTTAQTMASYFQSSYSTLGDIQQSINQNVISTVSEINTLANSIADLNKQIPAIESSGTSANSLEDQRGSLMDQLSKLVDINYYQDETGSYNISVAGGSPLVTGGDVQELTTATTDSTGMAHVVSMNQDITSNIGGGSLSGLIQVRDTCIPDYQDQLDTLAYSIISNVNTAHAAGTNLQTSGATTGLNFFTDVTDVSGAAQSIAVDSAIVSDINNIAAAQSSSSGDNSNALTLADLANQKLVNNGSETFNEAYAALAYAVGNDTQTASTQNDTQSSLLTQLQNQQDSASGVSMDEETVNLIRYQQAYSAAAHFISIVDQMTSDLISTVS